MTLYYHTLRLTDHTLNGNRRSDLCQNLDRAVRISESTFGLNTTAEQLQLMHLLIFSLTQFILEVLLGLIDTCFADGCPRKSE